MDTTQEAPAPDHRGSARRPLAPAPARHPAEELSGRLAAAETRVRRALDTGAALRAAQREAVEARAETAEAQRLGDEARREAQRAEATAEAAQQEAEEAQAQATT